MRTTRLLIVDDNPDDVEAYRRALKRAGSEARVDAFSTGEQALDVLFGRTTDPGRAAGAEHPPASEAERRTVILLDLNLPGISGQDVLRVLRADPRLRRVPVLILSTSAAPAEVRACYEAGASCYLQKPVSFADLERLVRALDQFWLREAVLPEL